MISEIYDIECLVNCFTYSGFDRQTQTTTQFVIHNSRNDYMRFMRHLMRKNLVMIGYNNVNYDYPILHHMIRHFDEYKNLSGLELSQKIHNKSNKIINEEFTAIAEWNTYIKQIDLMKIWHFDNKAKRTSLKDLEFAFNYPNVEDMPFDHTHWVEDYEIEKVLSYNLNDVMATNMFLDITKGITSFPLYKGKDKIKLRLEVSKKTDISMINFNDIKIGTELILDLYCKKFNKDKRVIRQLRSPRENIYLKDCLPKWTNFESLIFNKLINKFKNKTLASTKGDFKESVIFNGIKIDYGTGGAHASIKPGIYISDDNYIILDIDADGLYPCLAIQQGLYPEHLGPEFLEIYDGEIVSVRLKEKKKPKNERDFVIVEGFKLSANGFFGKTNSEDSYAYDPLYSMQTTISGQIMISMWIEKLVKAILNLTILQVNTDGLTIRILKEDKEKAILVTDEMTKITGLTYEFNEYSKMIIRDVNNYSAKYLNGGTIKHKGAFEIDKDLHKDKSMRIVPIALEKYFFEGIPIETTIKNHKNIYDFCLRLKVDRSWQAQLHYIKYYDGLPKKAIDNLSRTTRYYISNKGGSLYKKAKHDNRLNGVNVGYLATVFNKFIDKPMKEYDINFRFYINECNKIIRQIEDGQLKLW